jgi:hypothetical protein
MVGHICRNHHFEGSQDDIVQDIYFKFLTSDILSNYDPARAKISTYIYRIIKNHVLYVIKSKENKIIRCEVPNSSYMTEDMDNIDLALHFYNIAPDYLNIIERNKMSDCVEGIGFDLREFKRYFRGSRSNKHYKTFSLIDILEDIHMGLTNREIANKYHVTEMTTLAMKHKISSVMVKYGFKEYCKKVKK